MKHADFLEKWNSKEEAAISVFKINMINSLGFIYFDIFDLNET